jgi:hypothetical protein
MLSLFCSSAEFLHHGGKLLEGDLTITIGIDLFDDVIDSILA